MATVSVIEDLLAALELWIETNAPAKINAMEAVKTDQVMEDFASVEISARDPFSFPQYPVVLISPESIHQDQLSFGQDELTMRVNLVLVVADGAAEKLDTKTLRYMEVLRELVRDDRDMGGNADLISFVDAEFYPTVPGDTSIRLAVATVEIVKTLANS